MTMKATQSFSLPKLANNMVNDTQISNYPFKEQCNQEPHKTYPKHTNCFLNIFFKYYLVTEEYVTQFDI